jgi:hypothetical protein
MTIKTGILAAAAALTLALPAAALAQPSYGHSNNYGQNNGYSQNNGYGSTYDRGYAGNSNYGYGYGRADYRRIEREREWRREQELRRIRWEREHSYRYGYDRFGR